MTRRLFQRKKFLIKPGYQLKIALTLVISFIIYSIILAFILFYPLAQEFYASANIQEQAIISEQVLSLHTRLWPAVIVVSLLMGLQIILISHRIFGPVYRFEMTIKEYLLGDFSTRIKLRKHDEFKEMGALLNELAIYVEQSRTEVTNFNNSAKRRLTEISEKLVSGESSKIDEAHKILKTLVSELEASNEKFSTVEGEKV